MENLSIQSEIGNEILNASNENASIEIKKEIPAKKKNAGIKKDASQKDAKDANLNDASKKKDNLSKINFSQFAKELEGIEIIEKKEKIDLYIYPDNWNRDKINSSEGKNFRNKRRDAMQRYCNEIFIAYKIKDEKKLMDAIKSFEENYKSFYRINDYSLKSISQSNNASKNKNIQFAIDMIKEFKGMNKKEISKKK